MREEVHPDGGMSYRAKFVTPSKLGSKLDQFLPAAIQMQSEEFFKRRGKAFYSITGFERFLKMTKYIKDYFAIKSLALGMWFFDVLFFTF